MSRPDFTAHRHPVLAVPCPDCRAGEGAWCKRPSGHKADRDPVDAARDAVLLARVLLVQAHGHDERAAGGRVDLRAVMGSEQELLEIVR